MEELVKPEDRQPATSLVPFGLEGKLRNIGETTPFLSGGKPKGAGIAEREARLSTFGPVQWDQHEVQHASPWFGNLTLPFLPTLQKSHKLSRQCSIEQTSATHVDPIRSFTRLPSNWRLGFVDGRGFLSRSSSREVRITVPSFFL